MDDVTARIIVAVQAGDAIKQLDGVQGKLQEVTRTRANDLKLIRAKSRIEQETNRAAIASEKAINAELKMQAALRERNKYKNLQAGYGNEYRQADAEYRRLKKVYEMQDRLLGEAEKKRWIAVQEYDLLSESLNKVGPAAQKAEGGIRKFSASTIAARIASRTFGLGLGSTVNPAFLKLGLAVAGATAAFKLAGSIIEQYTNRTQKAAEASAKIAEIVNNEAESFKNQMDSRREAVSRLRELNAREKLYDSQKRENEYLVKRLISAYSDLGLEYDRITGKVHGLADAVDRLNKSEREELLNRLQESVSDYSRASQLAIQNAGDNAISGFRKVFQGIWWAGTTIGSLGTMDWKTERDEAQEFAASLMGLNLEDQRDALKDMIKSLADEAIGGTTLASTSEQIAIWEEALKAVENTIQAQKRLDDYYGLPSEEEKRAQAFREIIDQEQMRFNIQDKLRAGMEKEAQWLEREIQLRNQLKDITNEEIQEYRAFWNERYDLQKWQDELDAIQRVSNAVDEETRRFRERMDVQELLEQGENRMAVLLEYEYSLRSRIKDITDDQVESLKKMFLLEYDARNKAQQQESRNNLSSISGRVVNYRATAQNSYFTDSLESARLQSRMTTGYMGENLQKIVADQSKKQTNLLEDIETGIDKTEQALRNITVHKV